MNKRLTMVYWEGDRFWFGKLKDVSCCAMGYVMILISTLPLGRNSQFHVVQKSTKPLQAYQEVFGAEVVASTLSTRHGRREIR
jgi:hypothetical protein